MYNKRYYYTQLMKLAFQGLLYCFLFLTFISLLSITNAPLLNLSRTAAATMMTFAFVLFALSVVYEGYSLGMKKKRSVVAGITIATFLTDIISYFILQIMNVNPANPEANDRLILFGEDMFLLLLAMVLQFGLIYFFVSLGYYFHFELNPPERSIIITSTQEMADHVMQKVENFSQNYRICDVVRYDCPDVLDTILDHETVFLAGVPDTEEKKLEGFCYQHNKNILLMAELQDVVIASARQNIMEDVPFLMIRRMEPTLMQLFGKRLMDIVISIAGLIIASPIMILAAIGIRCMRSGSVFFTQKRATLGGQVFSIIKFRTMYENKADENSPVSAQMDDARVTPVGEWLRRYRIDELPQLFNVLSGEMSLVGPRPEMLENVEKYTIEVPDFYYRQQVKAGMTGLAQIEGKYNTSPQDKAILDLLYIENFSLAYDCKLILRTFTVFFRRDSTEGFYDPSEQQKRKKMRTKPKKAYRTQVYHPSMEEMVKNQTETIHSL